MTGIRIDIQPVILRYIIVITKLDNHNRKSVEDVFFSIMMWSYTCGEKTLTKSKSNVKFMGLTH